MAKNLMPAVAILIICHNGREYLRDCLESILASDDSPFVRRIVVVDNASTDGSADFLAAEFPQITLLRGAKNLGFAGGNNLGWDYIRTNLPAVQYLALLNQDTVVKSGWLAELASFMESRPVIAAAQARLMLHPRTDIFNSAGNISHFLGFGFTTQFGSPDSGSPQPWRRLGFVSGAAVLLRTDALHRTGLFDPAFFAYLEDADLSWKLRQLGYDLAYVPASVVYHKYEFKADWSHYYLLERNRWLLVATYYQMATLLLLLPALAAMEIGQFYFAWRNKILRQKLRAWRYLLDRPNLRHLSRRRTLAQNRRLISDSRFTAPFIGSAHFPELKSPLLRHLANPAFATYWNLARRLIAW